MKTSTDTTDTKKLEPLPSEKKDEGTTPVSASTPPSSTPPTRSKDDDSSPKKRREPELDLPKKKRERDRGDDGGTPRRQHESTTEEGMKKFLPWVIGGVLTLAVLLLLGVMGILAFKVMNSYTPAAVLPQVERNDTSPPPGGTNPNPVPPVPAPAPTPPPVVEGTWEQVPPETRPFEPRGQEVAKVTSWIQNNGFLVPVRTMPDGRMAGYGVTYSVPPEGGGALPPDPAIAAAIKAKTAKWTRNERGDWAIPQN